MKPPDRLGRWPSQADTGGSEPDVRLRVVRLPRPSLPWVWEFYADGDCTPRRRSDRGFRSAEDAWADGKDALLGLKGGAGPAR